MEKTFFTIMVISLLAACATNPNSVSIDPMKATIIAASDSIGSALIPLGSNKSTRIEKVNGKSVSDFFNNTNVLTVEPGIYTLEISCHVISGGLNVSGSTEHQLKLEAGKKYIFSANLDDKQGCKTTYEESRT